MVILPSLIQFFNLDIKLFICRSLNILSFKKSTCVICHITGMTRKWLGNGSGLTRDWLRNGSGLAPEWFGIASGLPQLDLISVSACSFFDSACSFFDSACSFFDFLPLTCQSSALQPVPFFTHHYSSACSFFHTSLLFGLFLFSRTITHQPVPFLRVSQNTLNHLLLVDMLALVYLGDRDIAYSLILSP